MQMQNQLERTSKSFSTTYSLYGNMLFKISMVYLGNKEDAEEAMQEAFYKLLNKAPAFNDDEHEKAWLIKTTVNICKDMLRSAWHKRVSLKTEDVERYYENPTDLGVLKEIVNLPQKYKTVIHLHYVEDFSVKQISQMLDIKESAIKMRLQRGRQLLKLELEGE